MKNYYRVPAEPEPSVCVSTDTISNHNRMKPCTAVPEKKSNLSKENCGHTTSSTFIRGQRSSSSSDSSPVNSKQLLASTPTSQTHSIISYLTPTLRQNVKQDNSTNGKHEIYHSEGKNSVPDSRVHEETPERPEQRPSNGRKRKLNLSTDQSQTNPKRRKGACKVKRKEVPVDGNSNSCSPCGHSSAVVARKQTPLKSCAQCLKQDQPSLQRYFKPKLDQ